MVNAVREERNAVAARMPNLTSWEHAEAVLLSAMQAAARGQGPTWHSNSKALYGNAELERARDVDPRVHRYMMP